MKNSKTNFSSPKIRSKYNIIVQKYGKEPVDKELKNLNSEFLKKLFEELDYQEELFASGYPYSFDTDDWEFDLESKFEDDLELAKGIISSKKKEYYEKKLDQMLDDQKYLKTMDELFYKEDGCYVKPNTFDNDLIGPFESFLFPIEDDSWETEEGPSEYMNPSYEEQKFWIENDGTNIKEDPNGIKNYLEDLEDIENIVASLTDSNVTVRQRTAEDLGRIATFKSVEYLIEALNDPEEIVVKTAAESLAEIGDERAIKPLSEHLDDTMVAHYDVFFALLLFGSKGVEAIEDYYKQKEEENLNQTFLLNKEIESFNRYSYNLKDIIEDIGVSLHDSDVSLRKKAANGLGILGDPLSVEYLIEALNDPEEIVVKTAAESLAEIGDERAIKPLENHLYDKISVSSAVTIALKKFGPKGEETIKNFWKKKDEERVKKADLKSRKKYEKRRMQLSHRDEKQRIKRNNEKKRNFKDKRLINVYGYDEVMKMSNEAEDLEKMIEEHCSKEKFSELIKTEPSESPEDSCWNNSENNIIKHRSSIHPEELFIIGDFEGLVSALSKVSSNNEKLEVIKYLGGMGDIRAVKYLRTFKNEKEFSFKVNETIEKILIENIEIYEEKKDVKKLISIYDMDEANSHVRKTVIEYACRIGKYDRIGKSWVSEVLIKALRDPDKNIKKCAIKGLGDIDDSNAIKSLNSALKDSELLIIASEAIEKIKKREKEYSENKKEAERLVNRLGSIRLKKGNNAANSLYIMGKSAFEMVVEAGKTGNQRARKKVCYILGKIADPQCVKPLIELLNDPNYDVRKKAAKSLSLIADRESMMPLKYDFHDAVIPLTRNLHDMDYKVRLYSIAALGNIGDEKAVPHLLKILNDKYRNQEERINAANSLEKIGEHMKDDYGGKFYDKLKRYIQFIGYIGYSDRGFAYDIKEAAQEVWRSLSETGEYNNAFDKLINIFKEESHLYDVYYKFSLEAKKEIESVIKEYDKHFEKGRDGLSKIIIEDHEEEVKYSAKSAIKEFSFVPIKTLNAQYERLDSEYLHKNWDDPLFYRNLHNSDDSYDRTHTSSYRERNRRLTQRLIDENDEYMDDIISGLYGKR